MYCVLDGWNYINAYYGWDLKEDQQSPKQCKVFLEFAFLIDVKTSIRYWFCIIHYARHTQQQSIKTIK